MTTNLDIPPGLILILGSLFVPFFRGRARNWYVILLPAIAFYQVSRLTPESALSFHLLGFDLDLIRADATSRAFGYIFTLNAFAAFIYGYYQKKSLEFVAALLYVGCSLMVVFAGDLFTLYVFWEAMAVTSVYLILARRSKKAYLAAHRYILVHVAGGLVLLAGIVLEIHQTGSISFHSFAPEQGNLARWLILVGFLVNAAAIPFSSWLPDAYPESTVLGGVILSAYTSKTAVYTLVRAFPGWEILIVIGCAMSIYGIIYALLENDMRRILAYSIINQVGFMVTGVGIGTPLAIAGTVAHAFCHIIYKALLWMSAGAVLYRTGKSKCTELGGLYITMPWTLILGGIGALAISSVPLTSGFTSKTIIIGAAASQHLFWAWLVLEIASAGVFLHAGIKFPYFVFFNVDRGLRPPEAPRSMLAGMGILAFLCLYLGMFPGKLYDILPYSEVVKAHVPSTFTDIYIHHFSHVVTMSQMLIFSGLVFFLCLPLLKRTDTISLDFDWFYRKGAELFYHLVNTTLNGINRVVHETVTVKGTSRLSRFIGDGPANLCLAVVRPFWELTDVEIEGERGAKNRYLATFRFGAFTVGSTAIFTAAFLLFFFVL